MSWNSPGLVYVFIQKAPESHGHGDAGWRARTPYDWRRDYVGYGNHPPDPQWPGGARIALNFNLNYEAWGQEANVPDGASGFRGGMLSDIGFPPVPGKRKSGLRWSPGL